MCSYGVCTQAVGDEFEERVDICGLREGIAKYNHEIEDLKAEVVQRELTYKSDMHAADATMQRKIVKQIRTKELPGKEAALHGAERYLETACSQLADAEGKYGNVFVKHMFANKENLGRRYADTDSLQRLPGTIRRDAARGIYVDVDIEMCFQMVIRETLRIKSGMNEQDLVDEYPALSEYYYNKVQTREMLKNGYNCTVDAAKELLLRLTHGGTEEQWKVDMRNKIHSGRGCCAGIMEGDLVEEGSHVARTFVERYQQEIEKIKPLFAKWYPECVKLSERVSRENGRVGHYQHRKGREFSHVAFALQTIENNLVEKMVQFFQGTLGHRVDVLIFDGFLVRRTESHPTVTKSEIRQCIEHVKAETDYNVCLSAKEM